MVALSVPISSFGDWIANEILILASGTHNIALNMIMEGNAITQNYVVHSIKHERYASLSREGKDTIA